MTREMRAGFEQIVSREELSEMVAFRLSKLGARIERDTPSFRFGADADGAQERAIAELQCVLEHVLGIDDDAYKEMPNRSDHDLHERYKRVKYAEVENSETAEDGVNLPSLERAVLLLKAMLWSYYQRKVQSGGLSTEHVSEQEMRDANEGMRKVVRWIYYVTC